MWAFAKRTAFLILTQTCRKRGSLRGLIHAQSQPLLLDLQIDIKKTLAVEGANRLHRALLAVVLRPDLIIRVRRKLAEPVSALIIGEVALHRKTPAVLQIDHRAFNRRIPGINHLALNHALGRPAILREQSSAPNSTPNSTRRSHKKGCHAAAGGKQDFADKRSERNGNTLHRF